MKRNRISTKVLMAAGLLVGGLGASTTLLATEHEPRYDWRDPKVMADVVDASIAWYDRWAWDDELGVYLSAVDNEGRPDATNGDKVFILATSRTLYALAHAPEQTEETLARAERIKDFILKWMVHPTEYVFREDLDLSLLRRRPDLRPAELPDITAPLTVNYQTYGLSGLVAWYGRTHDAALLRTIHQLFDEFVKRFHDEQSGWQGFFDADRGPGHALKSYNSTVYVATSFLFDLYHADPSRRAEYGRYLIELAGIVANYFVDSETGWIKENFTTKWTEEAWRGWQATDGKTIGSAGHNFQAAWLLMRASLFEGIESSKRDLYLAKAKEILGYMLTKPVVDWTQGGVYDAFIRGEDRLMWNDRKAWWQQAEAVMALTLALELDVVETEPARTARDLIFDFFVAKFTDRVRGGVYPTVERDGTPVEADAKVGPGTGIYHEAELLRVLNAYAEGDLRL